VAIEVGLQQCEESGSTDVHIATGSLTSMYQIKKIINRPQDMREHRHLKLLQHIVQTITDSICQVHIWKVKSHVGIVGNERADETAVEVSNGLTAADHEDYQEYKDESNNRDDMYWLYTEAETTPNKAAEALAATAAAAGEDADQPDITFVPEPNLKESLKARIHSICHLGQSNTKTIYHASWTAMENKIDHRYSHVFMTSTTVKSYVRKLVLQYRYGLLPTYKLLKRYKNNTVCCRLYAALVALPISLAV
jgi:ribonuclease HI